MFSLWTVSELWPRLCRVAVAHLASRSSSKCLQYLVGPLEFGAQFPSKITFLVRQQALHTSSCREPTLITARR